jgi:peptidoglycan-associated lipoprotein
MITNRFALPLLLLVLAVFAGCAGNAATTATTPSTPERTDLGSTTSRETDPLRRAAVEAKTGPRPTMAGGMRPSPVDFVVVADLKDVHFEFDKYDIGPESAKALDANARWLKSNAGHLVLIEGHCDERGTMEYNVALGERRAKTAKDYLVSHGVAASRVTVVSYGEERPACAAHDEACWVKNRRAHFLVKPQ